MDERTRLDTADDSTVPLVIDLDGTLIHSDLLIESAVKYVRIQPVLFLPLALFNLFRWLLQGKATLKERLALAAEVDITTLPYDEAVMALAHEARDAGRPVILATAAHRLHAERIAAHLGVFDRVLATDGKVNLAARRKQERLLSLFGERGFDYAANSHADLAVWSVARDAYIVNARKGVARQARSLGNVRRVLGMQQPSLRLWAKALRVHQWAKNLLIFVPLLASHALADSESLVRACLAFLLFGLCASSVYLANDILDLEDDRHHPNKRRRPFASGQLPVTAGLVVAPALFVLSVGTAALLMPAAFVAALLAYLVLTTAYSLALKRLAIVDVITLGLLYSLRLIAGAFAIAVIPTFWMLAFSLFIFQSLALVKRYAELIEARGRGVETKTRGRGYYPDDLPILANLGTTTAGLSVLVLAFYIQQPATADLYRNPWLIWIACPLLLFWVSRVWLIAHRGNMHDDPMVFAITDPMSLAVGVLFGLTFLAAL